MCIVVFVLAAVWLASMASKRRRLQSLVGLGGVSDAALQKIVNRLREEPGLLDEVSKKTLATATSDVMDIIGRHSDLPREKGDPFDWAHSCPQKLLQYFVEKSHPFAQMLEKRMAETPCNQAHPWSCVMYCDEVTPGNILRPDSGRKVHCFYMSFRELGPEVLCHSEGWLPIAVLRNTAVKTVRGKLSAAMRQLLRCLFTGPSALQETGVLLRLPSGPQILVAQLTNMLADESALKSVWGSKGAAALLPCFLCKNLTTRQLDRHDSSAYLRDLSCHDIGQFDLATNADVWEKVDHLKSIAGNSTKAQVERMEKAFGLSHSPEGVLADLDLRRVVQPITVHSYDSMHVALSNGIASFEIHAFLRRGQAAGVTLEALHSFLAADWVFPAHLKNKGRSVPNVFTPARQGSGDHFKAAASEVLLIIPVLRYFAVTVLLPTGLMREEIQSLLAMCKVVDELQALKRGKGSADAVEAAVSEHLRAFGIAYCDEFKPKHHFAIHLASQIRRDGGILMDAFVLERKHQMVKICAEHTDNTVSYEKSVLCRAVLQQLRDLQDPGWSSFGLQGRILPFPELRASLGVAEAVASQQLVAHGVRIAAGDIVQVDSDLLRVETCALLDQRLFFIARKLTCLKVVAAKIWRCRVQEPLLLVDCAIFRPQHVSCWTTGVDGDTVVLL